MRPQNQTRTLSRREFLKTLGVVASALVINPLPLLADSRPVERIQNIPGIPHPLKIGALLPKSSIRPTLSSNLLDGMKLYFEQAGGAPVEILAEHLASPARARAAARQLIAANKIDLMVGIAGANSILNAGGTFSIKNDGGANVLRLNERNPFVFHNTLGYWQANAGMGHWAARNLGRKAFVACSFYESGYDSLYAFCQGLEHAGGQVVGMHVAHVPPKQENLAELIAAIKHAQPDFVYALFSGRRAVDFVRAYADSGLANRIPLAGSAFMVDETLLPKLGTAALGIKSGLAWSPTLQTPENIAFVAAFQKATGRAPDAFAALGYDTGRVIAEALNTVSGNLGDPDQLRQAFQSVRFASPRGAFEMNPDTHTSVTPLYLREVQWQNGGLVNQVINELDPVAENAEWLVDLRTSIRSGWIHAYLGV